MIDGQTAGSSLPAAILGVTSVYHTLRRPERGAFIHALFQEWRLAGIDVRVVSPVSAMRTCFDQVTKAPSPAREPTDEAITRPIYLTLSNRLLPWWDLGGQISDASYRLAARRGMRRLGDGCELVYAHFFDSGRAVVEHARKHRRDSLVALGESSIRSVERINGPAVFAKVLREASGIVAVSRDNEDFVRQRCPDLDGRLRYIPNGVDTRVFRPLDRRQCRERLGLPADAFIAAFTGHFDERKGSLRVLEAIRRHPDLMAIFMGQGPCLPSGKQVLHASPVAHGDLPLWLCAADVFVLPSLAEGMCNAILEALACGLPLVVSDRSFNRSFLDEGNTLFVDPESPMEIGKALATLAADSARREVLAGSSIRLAPHFSLQHRAQRILEFYQDVRQFR
jgi:glycosyltransferase involved in cell wall biosynthesis